MILTLLIVNTITSTNKLIIKCTMLYVYQMRDWIPNCSYALREMMLFRSKWKPSKTLLIKVDSLSHLALFST